MTTNRSHPLSAFKGLTFAYMLSAIFWLSLLNILLATRQIPV